MGSDRLLLLRRPGLALGSVQLLVAVAAGAWALIGPADNALLGDAVAAIVVAVLGGLSLAAPTGVRPGLLELSAFATGAVVAAMMATRVTPQGVVAGAVLLLMLLVAVAMFVSLWSTVTAIGLTLGLLAAGLVANPVDVGAVYIGVLAAALIAVPALVHRLVSELRALAQANAEAAVRDPLTGAFNRRGVLLEATAVHAVSERAAAPTTVVAIDLDGFKQVNDTRGHAAGDDLLVSLVRAWTTTLRTGDVLGRSGGDEFLLVLPQCDAEAAETLLTRLREAHPFRWSYGLAEWNDDDDLDAVVARADALLYAAKPSRDAAVDLRVAPAAERRGG